MIRPRRGGNRVRLKRRKDKRARTQESPRERAWDCTLANFAFNRRLLALLISISSNQALRAGNFLIDSRGIAVLVS